VREEKSFADVSSEAKSSADKPSAEGKKSFFGRVKKSLSPYFTPFREMKLKRKLFVVFMRLFVLFAVSPILFGIIGVGVYAPLLIGLFILLVTHAWEWLSAKRGFWWSSLYILTAMIFTAGAVAFALVSGFMISATRNYPPANTTQMTVVVLGSKVNGNRPSLTLAKRLDVAAEFLLENPNVNCVVTGGQGADEDYPEAVIMKQYLIDKGVSASRIRVEDKSTSTFENLEFALDVILENNYYSNICIVTDNFHQLRASMICDKLSIENHYAVSSKPPFNLAMYYWFREMFGLARLYLLGY
jgi:uncharacterized SAM-binding protein YcdF (DUF218 family)